MSSTTVIVSGANGYIAQQLVSQLLAKGDKVIGQVRSEEKGKALAKIVDNASFSYVVVPVIEEKDAFAEALKQHPEVEIFYHTASPVTFGDDDVEEKILTPAINGTKYVLESLNEHAPQLKHFVYTSSVVAQVDLLAPTAINEESWSPITYEQAKANGFAAYAGSKKFAEEEVWKFRDQYKPKFTIATVMPAFVLGPQAYEANIANLTSTAYFFAGAISAKTREELEKMLPFNLGVDVRDVARAHITAAEDKSAHGKRLSLSAGVFNADTILTVLNDKYPGKSALKPNDPVTPAGQNIVDNKETRTILGDLISPEQSIAEAIEQHVRVAGF